MYKKHLSFAAIPWQKNSKVYNNTPKERETQTTLHLDPSDY